MIIASDLDRERVADRLRHAAAEGRLLAEELEDRLGAAFSARTYGQLDALVSDLPDRAWATPTPAAGWTIGHQIAHLAWTDRAAQRAVTDPDGFRDELRNVFENIDSYVDDAAVRARVTDNGPGIRFVDLPRAVLMRGYSTGLSLGLGYSVILELMDAVLLSTGPRGTSILMELRRTAPVPELPELEAWAES